MIRNISCWTLSRYSKWVIAERDDRLFEQLFKVMLDGMNDNDNIVQKAHRSALAVLEEESGCLFAAYLTPILSSLNNHFVKVFVFQLVYCL